MEETNTNISSSYYRSSGNYLFKKLNTSEDFFYLHKILGGVVLLNYLYRFTILFSKNHMNLENPISIMLLVIHGILSLSSLIFKLSNKRNKQLPIIYPEFRFHNILFAFRSIFCCLSFYFFNKKHAKTINMGICFATMFGADIITFIYKTSSTTTMRAMPYIENYDFEKKRKLREMNSFMQIFATYYMLGNINTAFSPMFAIQISSFLMTLVKKNIIKSMWWHYLYTIALWKNMVLLLTYMPSFFIAMQISCYFMKYWRIDKNYNKYIGWMIVFVGNNKLTCFLENTIDLFVIHYWNVSFLQYVGIFCFCLYFYFFYLKNGYFDCL